MKIEEQNQNTPAGLTIYRASAGSGKTYTLTHEYIRLLLKRTDYHRRILAVTFTNKATEEMKSRIVRELHNMATRKNETLIAGIAEDTGMSEPLLVSLAKETLAHLLHDYSHFSIVTIDSFFQRVIRAFAREMGLYAGYNVELDQETVLDESINLMLDNLEENKFLKDWLVEWAKRKIEEGKSWNFKFDVLKLGHEIFSEELQNIDPAILEEITDKGRLERLRTALNQIIDDYTAQLRNMGDKALSLMNTFSLSVSDFAYKEKGVGGYFLKLSQGQDASPTSYVLRAMEDVSCWYSKSSSCKNDIEDACNAGLYNLLHECTGYQEEERRLVNSARVVLKQINVLGILSDLMGYISGYARDQNLFLLSEASGFLKAIIDDADTPFIYERVGSFYNHFMIDEFQDTSSVQWGNFRPLLSNSIASGYPNWIVGDVKQSIYRWRNTDWKILSERVEHDLGSQYVDTQTLRYNWRSTPEVVHFNNAFFVEAVHSVKSAFLENEMRLAAPDYLSGLAGSLTEAYKDCYQHLPERKHHSQGYVQLSMIPDKEDEEETGWREKVLEDLPQRIEQLQDLGYRLSDIAILVRENKEAQMIADSLLEYRQANPESKYLYDVLSNESLLVGNSPVVKWLVAALRFIIEPDDLINRAYLEHEYLTYRNGGQHTDERLENMSGEQLFHWRNLSVYEVCDHLIRHFRLYADNGQASFLQAFQDILLQFIRSGTTDIRSFLNWWDEVKEKKYVTMPDNQNAIRLVTVHKSKGLEFDAVIIPFCDWPLFKPGKILWCRPEEEPFNEVHLLPLRCEEALKETIFVKEYLQEKILSYIDNLNLLYVAFTRARKALFISTPLREKEDFSSVSHLIQRIFGRQNPEQVSCPEDPYFIRLEDHWDADCRLFELGRLEANDLPHEKNKTEQADYFNGPVSDLERNMPHIRHNSDYFTSDKQSMTQIDKGKLMHDIFRNMITMEDMEGNLDRMIIEGKLPENERSHMTDMIEQALRYPLVNGWFKAGIQVKTEAELLLPDGNMVRPDRIMFDGPDVLVVDYKFGDRKSVKYRKQVLQYMVHLRNMGYGSVKGFIWYVSLNEVEEVKG